MEDRRAKRPWVRWLMLAVAVLELWLVWAEIQDYQQIAAADIFSPEAFAAWAAGERFQWLVYGTLAAIFLFNFAIWKLHQNARPLYIAEGIFFLLLTAAWGICAFFIPFHLLSGWRKAFFIFMPLATLVCAGYSIWKYGRLKEATEED